MRPAGERYIIPFLIDCLPCAIRRDAGKADRCLFNPIKTHFFLIGIFLSIDVSILVVRTVPLDLTNFNLEKIQKRRSPCPRGRATVHLIQ